MEYGFYHPDRGYWQTISEPPQHILDSYPHGTQQVPLKPGKYYEWQNGEWVYNPPNPTNADINRDHGRRLRAGKTISITNYGTVALDGLSKTQTILLALKDTARDLKNAGDTATTLTFTDKNNVDHELTPDQMIELVNASKVWVQELHKAKRSLKKMEPIPMDYTDDKWWT